MRKINAVVQQRCLWLLISVTQVDQLKEGVSTRGFLTTLKFGRAFAPIFTPLLALCGISLR